MDPKDKIIEGHEYDGIQEFDNPLPGWWLATFLGTIIFAFIYWIHYSFQPGTSINDEFEAAWKQVQSVQAQAQASAPAFDEQKLLAAIEDPARNQQGSAIYASKCAACHGNKGEGLVGPNLTDMFWIHGTGKTTDLAQVIAKGVLDKGMPAWQTMMPADELLNVIVYVAKFKGQNVPGKPPQGNQIQ